MSIFYGLATRALYFFLKMTRNGHFPRPAETDPYENVGKVMLSEEPITSPVSFDPVVVHSRFDNYLLYLNVKSNNPMST